MAFAGNNLSGGIEMNKHRSKVPAVALSKDVAPKRR